MTYTEAKEADVYEDAKVIVGGSFVHNSKTFIGEVIQLKTLNEGGDEWLSLNKLYVLRLKITILHTYQSS